MLEKTGIRYLASEGGSVLRQLLHSLEQVCSLRQDGIFQQRLVGNKRVLGGYAANRRVKVFEQLVGDAGGDLGAVPPTEGILVSNYDAIRLLHGRGYRLPIVGI